MLWDNVVGHSAVCLSLKNSVEQDRVHHAYLFSGPSGVGKFIVARTLAASMLCPDGGCGECNVCRRVMQEKHPDVRVIRPAGKNIPVETVREVRMDAFMKPSEGARKVYIFKGAERMWEEGASTLLKVLEEPPGDVVFILVTANPAGVLPTIRSRCQEVSFANVPLEQLKAYIMERKGISEERADLVVRLTGGVLGRALDWCDEQWRLTRRDNVIKAARALKRAELNDVLQMASELYREVRAPVEELSATYQQRKRDLEDGSLDADVVRRFSKNLDEALSRERVKEETRGVEEIMTTLSWWYRDILVMKEGGDPGLLVNRDLTAEIEEEAEAISTRKLLDSIDLLAGGILAAERNVPVQLNLESTLLGLQEALYA
ncbi:MAG: DNA polymerase III subunit delta' [Actinomycetota bacterium]